MWADSKIRDQIVDPADDEIVDQVHNEVIVVKEISGHQDGVRRPQWRLLPDAGDTESESRPVADCLPDSRGDVADHDPDMGDPPGGDGRKTL